MAARLHFRSLIVMVVLVVLAVGPRDRVARAGDPAQEGSWGNRFNWGSPPIIPIHMTVLPDGRVLSWNNSQPLNRDYTPALVWDGSTFTEYRLQGTDLFCSGHALMADGQVFVAGGNEQAGPDQHIGSSHANRFNYSDNQWTRIVPDMNDRRWYPTVTTLTNGDMLVTSGDVRSGVPNTIPQIWQAVPQAWNTLVGADKNLSLYPWMYVAPDGRVFYAGEKRLKWFLNTAGTGSWTSGAASSIDRSKGSSAMYEVTSGVAKILIMGGELNSPPGVTNTAEYIDLKAPSPAWQGTQMMSRPRKDHNATILADGTVLVTGGIDGAGSPVYYPEIWDPMNETWSTMAPGPTKRAYHSTAVLLPDGRLLTGGGVDADSSSAEIYSPPYLFKGPRPTINAVVPSEVAYGQTFQVQTPDAQAIEKVTWIRLSSVTHGFNENQRLLNLTFTRGTNVLNVTAPSSATDSPPGHYLLFILKGTHPNLVPSVARIMRIYQPQP